MHQPAPTFGAFILIGQRFFDTQELQLEHFDFHKKFVMNY
jgi:hypothetical protein